MPEEALALIDEHTPDLFIIDIETSDGQAHGLGCVQAARERLRAMKILVLSRFEDERPIEASLLAGADVYVIKSAQSEDLVSAIRQAFSHSIYFASTLTARGRALPAAAKTPNGAAKTPNLLTRRERELLNLLAEGRSNAQIATYLWVTEQTVKFHLSNIYRKLGVANRTAAARWRLEQQIGPEPISPRKVSTSSIENE